MTMSESAPLQTEAEAMAELFGITPADAALLRNDPYTRGVIDGNFEVADASAPNSKRALDPGEFIAGRLSVLKSGELSNHVTTLEVERNLAVGSDPSRHGDNHQDNTENVQ